MSFVEFAGFMLLILSCALAIGLSNHRQRVRELEAELKRFRGW